MKIIFHQWSKIFKKLTAFSLPVLLTLFVAYWFLIAELVYLAERNTQDSNIKTYVDSLWWGIVTFLTVGYGDKYPVTPLGRIFASFLMIAGVLVISLLTARISNIYFEAALMKRRGDVETENLHDHFIICGWTDDMQDLIFHIMDFNPDLKSERIIVLANIPDSTRDNLLAHPKLQDLGVIVGEYYTESQLRRAVPEHARKILILADRTASPSGQLPTQVEVDARTIMCAMSLSNIARGTMIAAEVLDPKMAQYLKIAGVSEIIYSREYSRLLLGNASGGTGVVNIMFDLLDPTTPSKISTYPVPHELNGKSYKQLKELFETQEPELMIIGILENFGNQQFIKEQALRKAQQTTDISLLVNNLKSVREIKCNQPIFHPDPNYIVHEGSLAIGIENRERGVHQHVSSAKNNIRAA